MPTTIRLARGGAKKRPYYHIVVANSRRSRDGKFIEKIGSYNPMLASDNAERVKINADRAKYWLSTGAQVSDRVQHFFFKEGLVKEAPKQKPTRKSKKDKGEAPAAAPAAAAPAAETPAATGEAAA